MDINHINAATMRNLAELQTNTFLKGMNTDTSDALLSSELYRYAENVRIVTDTDNNSGELRIVDGTNEFKKVTVDGFYSIEKTITYEPLETEDDWIYIKNLTELSFDDKDAYSIDEILDIFSENITKQLILNKGDDTIYMYLHVLESSLGANKNILYKINKASGKILATDSIRNICIYIVKVENNWFVYRMIGDNIQRVFGPSSEIIWVDPTKKEINTVLRYESDDNIKLYISDATGNHSIMILNVAPGKEYLETESFEDVFGYLNTVLPPIDVNISLSSGHIMSGKILYAYRLYSKYGAATLMSALSKVLSLYKNRYSGYPAEKYSGRAVDIVYPLIDRSKLDYIQIYRISYILTGQLPKIALIKDEPVAMRKSIDVGNDIEEVSVDDFLSIIDSQMFPKQIESKGDYLFAANLKYQQDDVDLLFESFDAVSYSTGNYIITDDGKTNVIKNFDDVVRTIDYNYLKHEAFPDNSTNYQYNPEHWGDINVSFTDSGDEAGARIIDFAIDPETGDDIDPDHGDITPETQVGTTTVKGYGRCICWKFVYDNIHSGYSANNQTNSIADSKSTFRCGETYRFGIRLFDNKGRASSVKWIADILIPPHANIYEEDGIIKFRNVGVEFLINLKNLDLWENVAAYEIVRCERTLSDRKNITQGIIGFPWETYKVENNSIVGTGLTCTPGFFSLDPAGQYALGDIANIDYQKYGNINTENGYGENNKYGLTINDFVMFACPEFCYQPDDMEDILSSFDNQLRLLTVYKTYPNVLLVSVDGDTYIKSNHIPSNAEPALYIVHKTVYDGERLYRIIPWGRVYGFNEKNRFSYFYPTYNINNFFYNNLQNDIYELGSVVTIESPKHSDYSKNETLSFKDNVVTISNKQFINWSTPLLNDISGDRKIALEEMLNKSHEIQDAVGEDALYGLILTASPLGSGGKTILFDTETQIPINNKYTKDHLPSITVMNVIKPCTPYGGYNKVAIDNSSYVSFGDYKELKTTDDYNIDIYSGDTKNRIFTYNASHIPYNAQVRTIEPTGIVYAVPVETDIDIQALYGDVYNVDGFNDPRIQDRACAFDTYTQEKDSYLYNTAYNATPDILSWTPNTEDDKTAKIFDTRIHYSELKTNNERLDSWTQFKTMNFLDVDSRYGQITDLKLFKDKLIFWQENATGLLAVNERVVLNDLNDTLVVLGTGGVLERYDYFTTIYGLKPNQHARAISNDSLYWWDGYNKEILAYQQKYDVVPLSTTKSIKNYINNNNESDVPFLSYDNKYKEVLANVVNNECVVYNEQILAFTSVYKFTPIFDFIVNGTILLTDTNTIYKYNIPLDTVTLFNQTVTPKIDYVVNHNATISKTFDTLLFGGRFYGGEDLSALNFEYSTPLKLNSQTRGEDVVTNIEYDFRLSIPRNGQREPYKDYGDRMRGKTMRCTLSSTSSNKDFSLQYIITKFRLSWT